MTFVLQAYDCCECTLNLGGLEDASTEQPVEQNPWQHANCFYSGCMHGLYGSFRPLSVMKWKRALVVTTFVSLLTGTLLTSKPSDVEAMIRIGKKAAGKIESALPEARVAAGPLAAFRAGDAAA